MKIKYIRSYLEDIFKYSYTLIIITQNLNYKKLLSQINLRIT